MNSRLDEMKQQAKTSGRKPMNKRLDRRLLDCSTRYSSHASQWKRGRKEKGRVSVEITPRWTRDIEILRQQQWESTLIITGECPSAVLG